MKIHSYKDKNALAEAAAETIAADIKHSLVARPIYSIAFSGGSTPALMLEALSQTELPWSQVHIFQVDERVAADGSPDRNSTQLKEHLLDHTDIPATNIHLMPVNAPDLPSACAKYSETTNEINGGVFDLVHLGLGDDGHTASLPPDDAVLEINDKDVWYIEEYKGLPRMTLTYPIINRANKILWLVAGQNKLPMIQKLVKEDTSIPAGRVNSRSATLLTDVNF